MLHSSPERALRTQITFVREGFPLAVDRFDELLPPALQQLSAQRWTPLHIAVRAVDLLVASRDSRILDVGSGPGKLCLIGALATEATFVGVEQQAELVAVANDLKQRLSAERAHFVHADLAAVDWDEFDAFYLFNPFFDAGAEGARFHGDDVATCVERLARARRGARVVTYHGMGGQLPPSYWRAHWEPAGGASLELWIKER